MIGFTDRDFSGNFLGVGEHVVTITKVEEQVSKKGNAMLYLEMTDRLGRMAKAFLPLAENARFRVAEVAVAAGINKESLLANGLNPSQLFGKKLLLVKKEAGKRTVDNKTVTDYDLEYFPVKSGEAGAQESNGAPGDDIPF